MASEKRLANSAAIDWAEVELRAKSGETAGQISKSFPIGKADIQRMIDLHGWKPGLPENDLTNPESWIEFVSQTDMAKEDRINAPVYARILAAIASKLPFKAACETVGINRTSAQRLRALDPKLDALFRKANAEAQKGLIRKIDEHADEDWRAASWLLERHGDMREDWGDKAERPAINITVNVVRDPAIAIAAGVVIDGSAEEVK